MVERSAKDTIGDGEFKSAQAVIEGVTDSTFTENEDLAAAASAIDPVDKVCVGIGHATANWSKMRFEEVFDDFEETCLNLLCVVQHAAALIYKNLVSRGKLFGSSDSEHMLAICEADDAQTVAADDRREEAVTFFHCGIHRICRRA